MKLSGGFSSFLDSKGFHIALLGISLFLLWTISERKWSKLHAIYGFRFLMFNKCLDYKASHPQISVLRRWFWLFVRIFLCGIIYDFLTTEYTIKFLTFSLTEDDRLVFKGKCLLPILKSFGSYLMMTLMVHWIPDEFMKKYYTDTSLTKIMIKLQYNVGFARAFILGSGRIYAAYSQNLWLFVILFIFAEGHPTELPIFIENWVTKGFRSVNWGSPIMTTFKYLGAMNLFYLYFRWTSGLPWKSVTYGSQDPYDKIFRALVLLYFVLFTAFQLSINCKWILLFKRFLSD